MIRDAEGTIVEYERGDVAWGIDPFKKDSTAGDDEPGDSVVPRPWRVISTESVPFHPEQYRCVTVTTRSCHDDAVPLTDESWEEGGAPEETSLMPLAAAAIKHDYLDTTGELNARLADPLDDSLTNGFQGRLTADVVDRVTSHLVGYLQNSMST